jgi:sulfate/thiosulfate transport system permease protein
MEQSRAGLKRGDLTIRATALIYLGFMVLLPIASLCAMAFNHGLGSFWTYVTRPQAVSAMVLTMQMSMIATVITVIAGFGVAWTLKRKQFIGKHVLEALIELPLALPAIVSGLILISLYGPQGIIGGFLGQQGIEVVFAKPGILLVLLFVTLPLMVRSVQPVMDELEPEVEQASFTLGASRMHTFAKVTLPVLWPSIAAGASLTVARALGEFGSLVLIAGNIPFKTEIAPTYVYGRIESGEPEAASAVAVVLLVASVILLLAIEYMQSRSRKVGRAKH